MRSCATKHDLPRFRFLSEQQQKIAQIIASNIKAAATDTATITDMLTTESAGWRGVDVVEYVTWDVTWDVEATCLLSAMTVLAEQVFANFNR